MNAVFPSDLLIAVARKVALVLVVAVA